MLKVLLCNIAIRDVAGIYPPVACTSLVNFLRANGYPATFYNIDVFRPSPEELERYFREGQYDLVGISAVVSTAYLNTKNLARLIKRVSPRTQIVVGGNMAAAYEILLRKCDIDICAIGEGEKILLNLVQYLEKHRSFLPATDDLAAIKGIAFLDKKGDGCVFTGPVELLKPEEMAQPDYEIFTGSPEFSHYVSDPMTQYDFTYDPRSHAPHRRGQKMATVFTSKGCINRCTFCHRWIRGYRVFPAGKVVAFMKELKQKFNVGFFQISDECFGEDLRWLEEFILQVKPLDVLFHIGGVRVSLVKKDPSVIRRLKDAGLIALYFGMESGCDKILTVMEKHASREDNLRAAQVCAEAGVFTTIQLVIGMPGENDQTIDETIDFVCRATQDLPDAPVFSVNYLQALPGTPCYDFLKQQGIIKSTVEDEEEYLLRVSDINACEFSHYINVTESPLSRVKMWRQKLLISARIAWLKRHHWKFPAPDKGVGHPADNKGLKALLAKIKDTLKNSPATYQIIDLLGNLFWEGMVFKHALSLYGFRRAALTFLGKQPEDRSQYKIPAQSLRKIVSPVAEVPDGRGADLDFYQDL